MATKKQTRKELINKLIDVQYHVNMAYALLQEFPKRFEGDGEICDKLEDLYEELDEKMWEV